MKTIRSITLLPVALLAACGATYRNPGLMSLSLTDAGGPVMLSVARSRDPGRDVSVSAGTASMAQTTSRSVPVRVDAYRGGHWVGTERRDQTVTTVSVAVASSAEGPSPQLLRRLLPGDRWVQIVGIGWGASDHSQPYSSHAERTLVVRATAHR